MDGRRLGSMDVDFSIDVVACARPPIVEPKARMKTLETYLIVLLLFIVVIVVVILIVLVIAVVVVAITIAASIVDIPSMVVSLARR